MSTNYMVSLISISKYLFLCLKLWPIMCEQNVKFFHFYMTKRILTHILHLIFFLILQIIILMSKNNRAHLPVKMLKTEEN